MLCCWQGVGYVQKPRAQISRHCKPQQRKKGLLFQVREEAVEVIVTAIDKHIADMSKCSKVRI